jgi:hypothetical protein
MLAVLALLLLGTVPLLRSLWYVSGTVLLAVFVYYLYSAARISAKFKDPTAMRLVILYYVRAFAWLSGGASTVANSLHGNRRREQN